MLGNVFLELAVNAEADPSKRPKHLATVKLAFRQVLQVLLSGPVHPLPARELCFFVPPLLSLCHYGFMLHNT